MLKHLMYAAEMAKSRSGIKDWRNHYLAAVGIRSDGTIVYSKNGVIHSSKDEHYKPLSNSHAECRVLRKMDWGGVIFVARVLRKDGSINMASPCLMCRTKIRAKGIKKVYYTVNEFQFGVWHVKKDYDEVITIKESLKQNVRSR